MFAGTEGPACAADEKGQDKGKLGSSLSSFNILPRSGNETLFLFEIAACWRYWGRGGGGGGERQFFLKGLVKFREIRNIKDSIFAVPSSLQMQPSLFAKRPSGLERRGAIVFAGYTLEFGLLSSPFGSLAGKDCRFISPSSGW